MGYSSCGERWYTGPPESQARIPSPDTITGPTHLCEDDTLTRCGVCLGEIPPPPNIQQTIALAAHIDFWRGHPVDQPQDPDWFPMSNLHAEMLAYGMGLLVKNLDLAMWAICQNYHAPNSRYLPPGSSPSITWDPPGQATYDLKEELQATVTSLICEGPAELTIGVKTYPGTWPWVSKLDGSQLFGAPGPTMVAEEGRAISVYVNQGKWNLLEAAWALRHVNPYTGLCAGLNIAALLFHEILHIADFPTYDAGDPIRQDLLTASSHLVDERALRPHQCDQMIITTNLLVLGLLKRYRGTSGPSDPEHPAVGGFDACCVAAQAKVDNASPAANWFDPDPAHQFFVSSCTMDDLVSSDVFIDADNHAASWLNGQESMERPRPGVERAPDPDVPTLGDFGSRGLT